MPALLPLVTACSAPPEPAAELGHHLLLLDEEGQILDLDEERVKEPRKHVNDMLDAMQAWLGARPPEKRRVVIHIHGGLTATEKTIRRAQDLVHEIRGRMERRPATGGAADEAVDSGRDDAAGDHAWPLFVSWPSGATESLSEGIWKLRNGQHDRVFGPITAPVNVATDLVQGAARAPIDLYYLLNDAEGARRHGPTEFWLLTLHPLADAGEAYFELADLPARGSLLEWIDDWYTSASHPLDRTSGKWNHVIPAIHLFEPVMSQVHFKAFGVDGDSLPQRHGDFNDCPFWLRDFWHPERMPLIPARD